MLALSTAACGAHGAEAQQVQSPSAALAPGASAVVAPAGDETKTVTVDYTFDRESATKDFDKTFDDGFEKKGLKVDESLTAHAHFDVKDAKITGTVTYVKKATGEYTILEADLVASGHYDADVQVVLDVHSKGDAKKASAAEWEKTLLAGRPVPLVKNLMPAHIPIAGPLALDAHFDLSASCEMPVQGPLHATTGVGIAGDVRVTAKYKRDADKPLQIEAKAPSFELAPKPYLKVEGKQLVVKGHCSLKPTAVLDLDSSIRAKFSVEPYVDATGKRASAKGQWALDAQAGVAMSAATDVEIFGGPQAATNARKQNEYALSDTKLTKPGDEMGAPTRAVAGAAAVAAKAGRPGKVVIATMLDAALGQAPAPQSSQPAARPARGAFGKKKKL